MRAYVSETVRDILDSRAAIPHQVPHTMSERHFLSLPERAIYAALCDAAERGAVCPNYLDLNEAAGYEWSSASPTVVARLERKGYIVVRRYQRFREVMIVATGQWTARSPNQHTYNPHVPRGGSALVARVSASMIAVPGAPSAAGLPNVSDVAPSAFGPGVGNRPQPARRDSTP